MAKMFKRVSYVRTSTAAVEILPTRVELTYGGKPFPDSSSWSLTAEAFDGLRTENQGVKFVETKFHRKPR